MALGGLPKTEAGPSEGSLDAIPRSERTEGFDQTLLRFGTGFSASDEQGGFAVLLAPHVSLKYPLSERFRLDVDWGFGILFAPGGVVENPLTGEDGPDDVPRTGNPYVELRWAAVREASGFLTDFALGFAAPMASIPQPTPPTGPDFQRSPHTERVYRRVLAARGFREPWLFLWDTASLVVASRVAQKTGPVLTDLEAWLGVLVPAGRLRADAGFLTSISAYAGVEVGLMDVGMRADLTYISPQRDEFDGSLQLRGAQLALAPEVRVPLISPLFVEGAWIISAGTEMEPDPEGLTWGAQLNVGARL